MIKFGLLIFLLFDKNHSINEKGEAATAPLEGALPGTADQLTPASDGPAASTTAAAGGQGSMQQHSSGLQVLSVSLADIGW